MFNRENTFLNSQSTGVSIPNAFGTSRTTCPANAGSPSTKQSLQKSFHLSHPGKIELKKFSFPSENKKYATAQPDTTMTVKLNNDYGLQTRWTRTPAGNSVLPQLAVTCKIEAECYYQTFVLGDSEVLRNPPPSPIAKPLKLKAEFI